jgi:diguanylate cyclase (GGDEF)-like protein
MPPFSGTRGRSHTPGKHRTAPRRARAWRIGHGRRPDLPVTTCRFRAKPVELDPSGAAAGYGADHTGRRPGLMELLLWRWSTVIQAMSDLIIALFFVVLAHSLGRRDLRPWLGAWLANLAALAIAIFFWLMQPTGSVELCLLRAGYLFFKTLFVLLLIQGASRFGAHRPLWTDPRLPLASLGVLALVGGAAIRSIPVLGLVQTIVIAAWLGIGGMRLLHAGSRFAWLATGFLARAVVAVAEILAYLLAVAHPQQARDGMLAIFTAAHSSFDTGAEWMIALGCVLTLYGAIQRELTQSNSELKLAQTRLHDLLHRDQLTGVLNRRALPTILSEARETGATVVFLDLDRFKAINDRHGHHAGDRCLQRTACALRDAFPAGDRVLRYAGDEFIVVSQDTEPGVISTRMQSVRRMLQHADPEPISFSYGQASLAAGGDADRALREADRAMYASKATLQH